MMQPSVQAPLNKLLGGGRFTHPSHPTHHFAPHRSSPAMQPYPAGGLPRWYKGYTPTFRQGG